MQDRLDRIDGKFPGSPLDSSLFQHPSSYSQRKGNYKKQFYRKADCLQTGNITFEAEERNIIPNGCQLGSEPLHVSTQTRNKSPLIHFARP